MFQKGRSATAVVITLCLGVLLLPPPVAADDDVFEMVYFHNYEPYSWFEDGKMRGILIDVVDELARRLEIDVSHSGHPWTQAQDLVRREEADGFVTVPTPERQEYTVVGRETVLESEIRLFVSPESEHLAALEEVKAIDELAGFSLADYSGDGWASKNLQGLEVQWLAELDHALRAVALRRADVLVQDSTVSRYNIGKLGLTGQVVELPQVIDSTTFRLCIGRESPWALRVRDFDRALREMRGDGSLRRIVKRYEGQEPADN